MPNKDTNSVTKEVSEPSIVNDSIMPQEDDNPKSDISSTENKNDTQQSTYSVDARRSNNQFGDKNKQKNKDPHNNSDETEPSIPQGPSKYNVDARDSNNQFGNNNTQENGGQ